MVGNPTESQLPKGADWVSRDFVQNLAFVDVYRSLDSSDYGGLSYSCFVKAGCFDALSGKKDSMANYYVISFHKPR